MSAAAIIHPLYRVNKFAVPPAARDEFIALIRRTVDAISDQAGFASHMLLEQESGPGEFNVVSIIGFRSPEAAPEILAAITDFDRQNGIDRPALAARLGVKADMGNFRPVAAG